LRRGLLRITLRRGLLRITLRGGLLRIALRIAGLRVRLTLRGRTVAGRIAGLCGHWRLFGGRRLRRSAGDDGAEGEKSEGNECLAHGSVHYDSARPRARDTRAPNVVEHAVVEAQIHELIDLVTRWVHVIAGIMWIGNSLLFNWLDRNLEQPSAEEANAATAKGEVIEGRIWLLHSGAFYDVVKKQLAPNQLPAALHWFKWQNFATWASGIGLLIVVYYMSGGALLVDTGIAKIGAPVAIFVGLTSIVSSWLFYHLLWISPLREKASVATSLSLSFAALTCYALTHVLSGRAAYIHMGVILGTVMTGNVWFVIVPSQHELVNATREGRAQDKSIGLRAKQRSIHNNYMTFPLLFIMVSNHFPSAYGSKLNWLILAVVAVGGALSRHWLNVRFWNRAWGPAMTTTIAATLGLLFFLTRPPHREEGAKKVTYSEVKTVIDARCLQCHAEQPTDDTWKVAPKGVMFNTPAQTIAQAARIKEFAFVNKMMPLGNKTGITDEERGLLADWADQGAAGP
jgi:hypothetical protein